MLKELLKHGAKPVGDPRGCHAVALDARAPKFDGGIVTRLDSVPFGIVVNKDVKRFYDEGEDFWPKRYAIWGRLIAQQPDQIAYSIIDSKACRTSCRRCFRRSRRARLPSWPQLGSRSGAACGGRRRVQRAVRPGTFDPGSLDDCRTEGLDAAEEPLGAADRYAAVLRLPAAAGHHFHLSRRHA